MDFKKYSDILKNVRKISLIFIIMLVFGAAAFSLGGTALFNFPYEFGYISCTKSMAPYMDCPCLLVYKNYDYGGGYNIFSRSENKTEENCKADEMDEKINKLISKDVKIGDVIRYVDINGRGNIVHRVIDKYYYSEIIEENGTLKIINTTQRGFYTKGDSNNYTERIDFNLIKGKLVWKSC